MRMSRLFSQTLRSVPSEATTRSHELLLRAGYVRQLSAGIFSLLPFGKRVIDHIAGIIREEIEVIGGQELSMPIVHPADIWKQSGRYDKIDSELTRFFDRNNREMVLAMTHEEVAANLARGEIRSYRQLPLLVYQIQTKWRDDPRPRAGLIRVREFLMKDSYSFDADEQGLEEQYRRHYAAYLRIFGRCGLPVIAVRSDVGMMGGQDAHEFIYLTPIGEDTVILCPSCGYAANRQTARFQKTVAAAEPILPMREVHTPGAATIDELCSFLSIEPVRTAKALFLVATKANTPSTEHFVIALIRGDMEVNETKLANAVGARSLRPATLEEIIAAGVQPGFGSAIGAHGAIVVVDDSVAETRNLVAGANRVDYHLQNTNYGRDYQADILCDIASAQEGYSCPDCGTPMRASRGVEVGNIFKLGTAYSRAAGAFFLDRTGTEQPVFMGSYGIGLGRLLACVAEQHNDGDGLRWPVTVAPYEVHLVGLNQDDENVLQTAEKLYRDFWDRGITALYDDRAERPGVKFKDADLIGIPIRCTVSARSLASHEQPGLEHGGVECKLRGAPGVEMVAVERVVQHVTELIAEMKERLRATWDPESPT